jgi:dihydroceramidase
MVWHLLMCTYIITRDSLVSSNVTKHVVSGLLLTYAVIFSVLHLVLKTTTAFQVHFGLLLTFVLSRLHRRFRHIDAGPQGRRLIKLFVVSGLTAFACWLFDYNNCAMIKTWPVNPHGHVWWHLLMGYAAFTSVVLLKVSRPGASYVLAPQSLRLTRFRLCHCLYS